jgi:hypothetical protein
MVTTIQPASRFHAARRAWPIADIRGDGPFAVVTGCGHMTIVYLHCPAGGLRYRVRPGAPPRPVVEGRDHEPLCR